MKHREDGCYVGAIMESNDFVMLVPVTSEAVNYGYIAILSTESMSVSEDPFNYMRVHPIMIDSPDSLLERGLFFEPTHIRTQGQTILVYGRKGILIGNIPSPQENKRYRAEYKVDKPLVCHVISYQALRIENVEVLDC